MPGIELSDIGLLEAITPPGGVVKLRYSSAVLEQIRAEALEKFLSIPRGGLEIGGVLYGSISPGEVKILARRPLAIEYLSGPSFLLSSNDETSMSRLMEAPVSDSELQGMQAVGWYHSHTRTDIALSEQDIAVHEKLFPLPEHVALVIKPHKYEPAQVGIYLRDAAGVLRGDVPYSRLLLKSRQEAEGPIVHSDPPPRASAPPTKTLTRETVRPLVEAPRFSPAPAIAGVRDRGRRRWPSRVAIAAALVVTAAAVGLFMQNRHHPLLTSDSGPMHLRTSGDGEQLIITWNPRARSLTRARSAEMIIADGEREPIKVPLDSESVNRGTITYFRHSAHVEVRMRVQPEADRVVEEVVQFTGPAPGLPTPEAPPAVAAAPAVEPNPEVERMKAELERLKTELSRVRPEGERTRTTAALSTERTPVSTGAAATTRPQVSRPVVPPRIESPALPTPNMVELRSPAITAPVQLNSPVLPATAPQLPAVAAPSPAAVVPAQKAPVQRLSSGRAIWTGRLPKGGLLLFEGSRPSVGTLNGPYPQRAARMRVYPAELGDAGILVYAGGARQNAVDPPSAANGWNLTTYSPDAKRSRSASVLEYPGPKNDWKRLLIRSEDRALSMLVIDWEEIPVTNVRQNQ